MLDYIFMRGFSGIFRELMNNPMDIFLENIEINIASIGLVIFITYFWPIIRHMLIFFVVGGIYKTRECPGIGSMLYLIIYILNNQILNKIILWFKNMGVEFIAVVFCSVCIIEFLLLRKLRKKIKGTRVSK